MRSLLTFTLFFIFSHHLSAQGQTAIHDAPDQIVWHEGSRSWYVSNLGGGVSFARDGYGWITKIDHKGKVSDPLWIQGLDAPSGMVVFGDMLYVCDRPGILEIDIETAKIVHTYPVPGSTFINDIAAASNGDLYVSDFFGDRIFRLPAGSRKAEKFLDIPDSPDGLYVDRDHLMIATWGKIIDRKTFVTSNMGNILSVDLKTKIVTTYLPGIKQIGNLEGITKVGPYFYVTDWMAGKLLRVSRKDGVEEVLTGLKNPTDLDYSPSLGKLAFPEHGDNRIYMLTLSDKSAVPTRP